MPPVFEGLFKLADGRLGARNRDGQILCLHGLGGPGKGEDNKRNNQRCQQGGADDLNPGGALGAAGVTGSAVTAALVSLFTTISKQNAYFAYEIELYPRFCCKQTK